LVKINFFYYNSQLYNTNNMTENNGNSNDHTTTKKFRYTVTKNILNSDKSIRWVAITDQDGNIINEQNREGLKLLLTKEEN